MHIINFDDMSESVLIGVARDALSDAAGLAEQIYKESIAKLLITRNDSGELYHKLHAIKSMLATLDRKIAERERA